MALKKFVTKSATEGKERVVLAAARAYWHEIQAGGIDQRPEAFHFAST